MDRSLTADRVLDILTKLSFTGGVPRHILSDNGPEFIATAIRRHGQQAGLDVLYIDTGGPWKTASPNCSLAGLADQLLNTEEFMNLAEALVR